MSFAVSRDRGAYEWSGKGIGSVFAQTINIFNPAQWRLVWDVLRFNTFSLDILKDTADKYKTMSIGEYIEQNGYSDSFRDNYLLVSLEHIRANASAHLISAPRPSWTAHDSCGLVDPAR